MIAECLRNWIPVRLVRQEELLCRWLYTGDKAYTDPFFDETVQRSLIYPENVQRFKAITTLSLLPDWSAQISCIAPTTFIFHVSRCGSTLVSQALGMKAGVISLSEVPLFDELLRSLLGDSMITEREADDFFSSAVRFYGAKRTGFEKHLFIKTDSWHLMFYERLRRMYPKVPFIILYREPCAVLESNRRKRGWQGIPEMVGPAVYGFDARDESFYHPDNYMEAVLQKFYERIITIARTDECCLLVNYNEGLPVILGKIEAVTGITYSDNERSKLFKRSAFDAKNPYEHFEEKNKGIHANEVLGKMYLCIEELKCGRKTDEA